MEKENRKLKALVVFTEEKVNELARRTKRISTELKALSETITEIKNNDIDEVFDKTLNNLNNLDDELKELLDNLFGDDKDEK